MAHSHMVASIVRYEELKQARLCTQCGKRPAAEDSGLCPRHRDRQRKRKQASKLALRRARRDAGLCIVCELPSKTYRCAACYAIHAPSVAGVSNGVDTAARAKRIAAKTAVHADGRTRYHGQGKRGYQPAEQLDAQDYASALKLFAAGYTRLGLYRSPEVQAMPRVQRESVRRQATQELDLGARFVEDIQERNGHFNAKHGRRNGE